MGIVGYISQTRYQWEGIYYDHNMRRGAYSAKQEGWLPIYAFAKDHNKSTLGDISREMPHCNISMERCLAIEPGVVG